MTAALARKRAKRPAAPKRLSNFQLRAILERGIEQLVALLDEIDGDADVEQDLGGLGEERDQTHWSLLGGPETEHKQDMEPELSGNENVDQTRWGDHGGDSGENSLGSLESVDQRRWGDHWDPKTWAVADGEEECEDEGAQCEDEGAPTGDDEPWLGREIGLVLDGEILHQPEWSPIAPVRIGGVR